jgi:elongation factor P
MIDVTDLRRGVTFLHDNQLLKVIDYEHRKMGRGGATIRVKVRNVRTGSRTELTFNSGSRVESVRLEKRPYEYLYEDGDFFVFMDTETYSQREVAQTVFGDDALYLKHNMTLDLLHYDEEIIDYELPVTVEMEVIETEMAIAGNTATGATKEVILETGLKVRTPLFVEAGNRLRVDTRTGEYITRV